jgi:hypothetical protein
MDPRSDDQPPTTVLTSGPPGDGVAHPLDTTGTTVIGVLAPAILLRDDDRCPFRASEQPTNRRHRRSDRTPSAESALARLYRSPSTAAVNATRTTDDQRPAPEWPVHSRRTSDGHDIEGDLQLQRGHGGLRGSLTEIGDMTMAYETHTADADLADLFKGLPGDMSQAAHYGYVITGKVGFRYADGTVDEITTGESYVATPGHTPILYAGTEVVEFTNTERLNETMAAVMRNI